MILRKKNKSPKGFNDFYSGEMRGDFRCELVKAATGEIVDEHEKHNLIMTSARTVISKLFAGMSGASLPDSLMIGTAGNQTGTILIPKDEDDGFTKARTTLFSCVTMEVTSGDIVDIKMNSYIEYTGSDDSYTGLYLYTGNSTINFTFSDVEVSGDDFELTDELPDTFTTTFTVPGTSTDEDNGDDASATNGATMTVLYSGTAVTFKFELGTEYGNGDDGTRSYTEAGIFAGDDIFCMKTFPAKIKDETVIFRIYWTITF